MHSRESARYDGSASITRAPKLHRLTPVPVPFVLLPHRKGSALRWSESGSGAGRELKILGAAVLGFGGVLPGLGLSFLLAVDSVPAGWPPALAVSLLGCAVCLAFLAWG